MNGIEEVRTITPKRKYINISSLAELSSSDGDSKSEPSKKKPASTIPPVHESIYSSKSLRMMQNMGYRTESGLGKMGQGRLKPVDAFNQQGRRGLGLELSSLDLAAEKWDSSLETIQFREYIQWLHNNSDESCEELQARVLMGPKSSTINNEDKFCDSEVLENVLSQKTIFDNLGAGDMRNARTRSNPFESIRSSIFQNRAAVKMANIDAIFGFMFTRSVDEDNNSLIGDNSPLYFADVCAGPGGFSEYILWRKNWVAKGFGFTLKSENDFKLHQFLAGHPETFDPHYGVKGDGNIYDPDNITSFTDYVFEQSFGAGVHFMMSDGGFSVEGQENIQEILSKQLYLCQCLVALSIVRENGHFVTKLFDTFTPFSVGLIYLMHKCFKQICIVKPNTSRPANSERYLVCKWKRPNTDAIRHFLFNVNRSMWENSGSSVDFIELVPHRILQQDEHFFNYMDSNNQIGRNQTVALMKIAAFCKNPILRDTRQSDFQRDSLHLWRIPNQYRKIPLKLSCDQLFSKQMGTWLDQKDFLTSPERMLTSKDQLERLFHDLTDWYFVPLDVIENSGKNVRTFFISRGGREVYRYADNKTWELVTDVCIEMTPDSLVYGEIAKELSGEGLKQTTVYALHIIDGMFLGGVDIRKIPFSKRLQLCNKFAMALNKPSKLIGGRSQVPIRCKKSFQLAELRKFFECLNRYKLKDGKIRFGMVTGSNQFFIPRGILLFAVLKPNLHRSFDTATNRTVYTDMARRNMKFYAENLPDPDSIFGSFKTTFPRRRLWKWDLATQVEERLNEADRLDNLLYRTDLERFLYSHCEK